MAMTSVIRPQATPSPVPEAPTGSPVEPKASSRTPLLQWTVAMAMSGTVGAAVVESGAAAPVAAFARCLIGGVLLLIWSAARGWLRPGRLGLTRRELGMVVLGGLLLVGNWVLLFSSYALSSISISTVVYHTQPLMLVGLAAVLLGERINGGQLMRAVIAFAGVGAISLGANGVTGEPVRFSGIALALGAAMLYAGATLIAKQLSHLRPHVVAGIQLAVGAVLLAPVLLVVSVPMTAEAIGWLLLLGTVHTALMYVLMYSSVGKLSTGTVAIVSYLYPVVAVIVDVLAYDHRVTLVEAAGMLAVLLAALAPRKSRSR